MKKLLLSIALVICSLSAFSQAKYKMDAAGNYIAVKSVKDTTKSSDLNTGKTFTDSKGGVWPVYKSSTGRIYALRTSKTGNKYKQYLNNPSKP